MGINHLYEIVTSSLYHTMDNSNSSQFGFYNFNFTNYANNENVTTMFNNSIDNENATTTAATTEDDDWFRPNAQSIKHTAFLIVKIFFPIFVAMGTIGNVMVVCVLRRGAIRTDNLRFFLSALALVDTIFLYTSGVKTWVRVVWGFEFLHVGDWSCQVGLFLSQLSVTLSAWLLVVITWQRWHTCSQPFHRCCPSESSHWRYLGLASLVIALIAINSYVLITVERMEVSIVLACVYIVFIH